MFFQPSFRRTVFISVIGHIAVFGIFNLSFGNKIYPLNYVPVSFWGQFLGNSEVLLPPENPSLWKARASLTADKRCYEFTPLEKAAGRAQSSLTGFMATQEKISEPFLGGWQKKPCAPLVYGQEKQVFNPLLNGPLIEKPPSFLKRPESRIMFHPLLPYSFALYFKDRQTAHVELLFNIISSNRGSSIVIKRKISSGNLEADLLVRRYIGHYLFIQQARFIPDSWQSVKIDLSAEE